MKASNKQTRGYKPWYRSWFLGLIPLIGFGVIALVLRLLFYQPYHVPSNSMYPTLKVGTVVTVSKFGYDSIEFYDIPVYRPKPGKAIHRGDIMVFKFPEDMSLLYIKRVVGLPGDKIVMQNQVLYLNGQPVQRKKVKVDRSESNKYDIYEEVLEDAKYQIALSQQSYPFNGEFLVPEGQYFCARR